MEITINEIKANLESLPKNFYGEVNDFIDFLKHKYSKLNKDEIAEWQKEEVRRRIKYAQQNPQSFVSESEMEDYIKDLENEG